METKETTRVYQYGAVPVGPFPQEGVDELFRGNSLWNKLVEIDRESREKYDEARRKVDAGYREAAEKVDAVNREIDAAYDRKRSARMKAGTRDADHPLIKEANREIRKLETKRKKLWEEVKPHRKNADKRIDKKALNDAFRVRVNEAQRVKNTGGLDSSTANEIARYFRVARGRTFDVPGSRLRIHAPTPPGANE